MQRYLYHPIPVLYRDHNWQDTMGPCDLKYVTFQLNVSMTDPNDEQPCVIME